MTHTTTATQSPHFIKFDSILFELQIPQLAQPSLRRLRLNCSCL